VSLERSHQNGSHQARRPHRLAACVLALSALASLFAPAHGRAATISVGSQTFGDFGNTTVVGNDVDTGSIFSFGNLIPLFQVSGYFVSMPVFPTVQFGAVTINVDIPSTVAFGSPEFGYFQADSVVQDSLRQEMTPSGTRSFKFLGHYSHGTSGAPLIPNPAPAELRINFTESGSVEYNTFSVTANATMSIPPTPIPEPPTIMLASVGLAGAAVVRLSRRKSSKAGAGRRTSSTSGPRDPDSRRGETACRSS
jgi:hypothetical protein